MRMGLYSSHYPMTGAARSLFFGFVRLYFRPQVTGRENLPQAGPFILVSNHASHVDTAVLFGVLPRHLRQQVVVAAARDYFFDESLRQSTARLLFNAIPIDREPIPGENPLRHAIRALDEGYGLVIYPEGTRSLDGTIGRFRRGIGRLIAEFPDLPVIPAYLNAAARAMPKGARIPRPYTVRIRFGPPLYPTADLHNRASWKIAANAVRVAIIQLQSQAQV
jgi:1-acyl-sn-glycerol-3-phosphate acyltransferase